MFLPCELVGLSGDKMTKEMREKEATSCIEWKIDYEKVPKPSAKSYEIWIEYTKWLQEQKIMIIVDFEPWIQTKYEISVDTEYIREKRQNEIIYYKKGEMRYGQQTYERIETRIEVEWKKMIAELKQNGVLEVYGVFYCIKKRVKRNIIHSMTILLNAYGKEI